MQMISNPIIMAPSIHNKAIGLNDSSRDGLIKQIPPTRDIVAPNHLIKSIFSFKK